MELAGAASIRSGRGRSLALRAALGMAIGAALVAAFLRIVNVSAAYQRLTHLRLGFAVLCGVAFVAAYIVRAMRWRWLLKPCDVGIGRVIAIYQVATFVNWILPIRGGELVKSLLLRRTNGIQVSRSLATIGIDKAMDLIPAVALVALLPFVAIHLTGPLWLLLISALAVDGLAVLVLVFAAWRRDRALGLLSRIIAVFVPGRLRGRVDHGVRLFVDSLLQVLSRPRVLGIALVYTMVAVSLDALFCLLAFKAVDVNIGFSVVLYGYTFYNLAFILPTPPGQVGSNELVGLLIFSGLFGVSRSGVAAMFLFSHPWTALLMTCSGLMCLSYMGLSLRTTVRLAEEPGEMATHTTTNEE